MKDMVHGQKLGTHSALKVRENPITKSHGKAIQAASAPFLSVTPMSIVRGMMLRPCEGKSVEKSTVSCQLECKVLQYQYKVSIYNSPMNRLPTEII